MCEASQMASSGPNTPKMEEKEAPVNMVLQPPSILARYTCASILMAFFGIFVKYTFVPEAESPGVAVPVHSYKVPLALTLGYLVSLPLLKMFADKFLRESVDTKLLLRESMVLYNAGQVALNGWMVYRFLDAVLFRNHPVVGDFYTVTSGATYTVWVHYCDKYLEFFDTYFMILRGRMDQVSARSLNDSYRGEQLGWFLCAYVTHVILPFLYLSRSRFFTFITTLRLLGRGGQPCASGRAAMPTLVPC